MRNHTLLFGILLVAATTGCRSWNASLIAPQSAPITPKLLTLDRRLEDIAMPGMGAANAGVSPQRLQDEIDLFTKEVERNLVDPYGEKYGTIAFTRNIIDARYGMGGFIASSLLFTCPTCSACRSCTSATPCRWNCASWTGTTSCSGTTAPWASPA